MFLEGSPRNARERRTSFSSARHPTPGSLSTETSVLEPVAPPNVPIVPSALMVANTFSGEPVFAAAQRPELMNRIPPPAGAIC
jgi:hypothetical protein